MGHQDCRRDGRGCFRHPPWEDAFTTSVTIETCKRNMRREVIIGGGCAGIVAALEAEKNGGNVMLIGRSTIGIGTNSALSNGIFAGPTPQTTPEEYIRKTLQAGRGLNRESMVNLVTREAPEGFFSSSFIRIGIRRNHRPIYCKAITTGCHPGVNLDEGFGSQDKGIEPNRSWSETSMLRRF